MNIFKIIIFLLSITLLVNCNFGKKEEVSNDELSFKDVRYPELNALNDAIEDDADNGELYYKRAKVYLRIHQINLALTDVSKAIQLDNIKAPYYALLATIYQKIKKPTLALNAAKKCEALNWQSGELPILLAQIYLELKDVKNTRFYLDKANQTAPQHVDIIVLEGKLAGLSGDSIAALKYFFLALDKEAKNEEALTEISLAFDRQNKEDSSMIFILRGMKANPRNPFFLYQMGQLLAKNKQFSAAQECYLGAIEVDSSYHLASQKVADHFVKQENFIEALKWYIRTIQFAPNSVPANLEAATVLEKLGRERDAISYYRNIMVVDPSHTKAKTAYERLILLYPSDLPIVPLTDTLVGAVPSSDSLRKPTLADTANTIKKKKKILVVKSEVLEIANDIPLVEETKVEPAPNPSPSVEEKAPSPVIENSNTPAIKKKKGLFGKKSKNDSIQ